MAVGDKLFVADKPTLDNVKNLIGASGAAAGISTLFAYLARLEGLIGTGGGGGEPGDLSAVTTLIGTANPAEGSGDLSTLFKGLRLIADYVDTVETKIGTSWDAAGTSTLFARLAQIAGYTDQVEGYVDTLKTLIGTASPASGDLSTLFRGLKLIADYVDTLETKVGLNSDAAGSSTLFARLAQIAGFVDTLETLVGTASPGTAGTDTLFKYLKKVNDAVVLNGIVNIYSQAVFYPDYGTVFDISGSGILNGIFAPAVKGAINAILTIDGTEKFNDILYIVASSSQYGAGGLPGSIRFNSSLKLEVKSYETGRPPHGGGTSCRLRR